MKEIAYPVYLLGKHKPSIENGVVFYHTLLSLEDGSSESILHIVDDKNIDKPTLSKRRLVLLNQGVPLKKLKTAIFFLGDLIKLANAQTWFIDSNGTVFNHKKCKTVPLIIKKVTKVIPIQSGGALVELESIPTRFKVLFQPEKDDIYAGVLKDGMSYIFYSFYKEKFKDTRRKI